MAGNQQEAGFGDDFFEQILSVPPGYGGGDGGGATLPMGLQLGSGGGVATGGSGCRGFRGMGMMPLELNLEHGFLRHEDGVVDNSSSNNNNASCSAASAVAVSERDSIHMVSLFPPFGQMQAQQIRPSPPPPQPPQSLNQTPLRHHFLFQCQTKSTLVWSRDLEAAKLCRIVLSMSRLGAAGAVTPLVADIPLLSVEMEASLLGKMVKDGTEQQVAKLMEEDIGAAMQFLQSKALCIVPISLTSAIFPAHQSDAPTIVPNQTLHKRIKNQHHDACRNHS
ncbi:Hcf106 protein [Hibiscus syriacus]|uniref:Hcf106 protein n=1 Tax=Hibiscus syriacus TaxID=106335 RepID=A0A6A3CJ05_HIBSY|nr:Hcf106 protein [Hibiscus syriacus]